MLVLLFLCGAAALEIDFNKFDSYEVEFNSSCEEYFLFYGTDGQMFTLLQDHEYFQLWVANQNTYEIYIAPWSSRLVFSWPDKIINGAHMSKIKSEVEISPNTTGSRVECNIYGLKIGTLNIAPTPCGLYKCESTNWKIYLPTTLTVLFFILFAVNGSKNTVLRSQVPRLIQRFGEILSRSPEAIPRSEEERDSPIYEHAV